MALRFGFGLIALLGLPVSALACQSVHNLIGSNCGFTAGLTGWENLTSGTCQPNNTIGVTDANNITCSSFAGAINHVVRFRYCIKAAAGVAPNRLYAYGAWGQKVSGGTVSCTVQAADWSQDNCQFNINAETTPLDPGGAYVQSTPATYTTGANAVSVHVQVECTSGSAFQIRVDDATFLDDRIFGNGFQ
ncbi:hypothetical protein [Tahibacter amnicola]|uniref:Cyanovirin-N domain-containing protein n=1 Tax=Tahibacter amnicola TaxID=2976241 RepID=A0ABY6BKS2_9GAMM|nr:hypothetical protein [Tahibacter amnicola]UXI68980.1 hypothetical protein N4264_04825 [Tahibacter amnicola]